LFAPGAKVSFDFPEDIQGGMVNALKQSWSADSVKHAFLICDAPAHGSDVNQGHIDNFSGGHPEGYKI
jgi:hypothetical protein